MSLHFGFDDRLHGLFVVVEREPLSPGCISAQEIDSTIEQLKTELDMVGRRMKVALATRKPITTDQPEA